MFSAGLCNFTHQTSYILMPTGFCQSTKNAAWAKCGGQYWQQISRWQAQLITNVNLYHCFIPLSFLLPSSHGSPTVWRAWLILWVKGTSKGWDALAGSLYESCWKSSGMFKLYLEELNMGDLCFYLESLFLLGKVEYLWNRWLWQV